MASFTARCQVLTNLLSNPNPRDVVVNTFHFTMDDVTQAADAATISEEIEDIYEGCITWLSDEWNWAGQTYKFYDLSDPEPRAPFYEAIHGTGVAPTGQGSLPREVALCMSFQGFKASGVPQARRRGRVYLGPFGINANADGRPTALLLNAVENAGQQLLDASVAAGSWEWVVRSQVAGTTIPVDNGWVDNEWDTIRRRGPEASARQVFT